MALVRRAGQITNLPYDRAFPVSTYWDIGQSADQMSIIFYQKINNKHCIIDYHESNNEGWDFYGRLLQSKNFLYEKHYFPHDGNKRIVGTDIQTSRQLAEQVGIRPIQIIPQTKSVWEDIRNYCKPTLPTIWFDESKASLLINRLDSYTRRWDKINAMWLNDAMHNEASHGADAYRTLVIAINQQKQQTIAEFVPPGYYAQNSYSRRN
jgi:phage terminase large subunit